ncbi:MAG: hypothetical protein AAGA23_22355 [Pseudomonadota bacterium]
MSRPGMLLPGLFMFAVATTAAAATDWRTRLLLQGDVGIEDNFGQTLLELEPELRWTTGEQGRWVASLRLRLDGRDEIEPGQPQLDNYAPASRPLRLGSGGVVELRDLYYERPLARGRLRLGKQQFNWGRLDRVRILDLINPQNFREFILADFTTSRVSLWSAYFDLTFGEWQTELVLAPDGTGHQLPEPGAWFQFTAPRFNLGSPLPARAPLPLQRPGHGADDAAAALRINRRFGATEWSLVGYSGLDHEPLGAAGSVPGVPEQLIRRRQEVLGWSADATVGDVVLRIEHAMHLKRWFNTVAADGIGLTRRRQHRVALGADLNGPWDTFINVQWVLDSVEAGAAPLVRPRVDRLATLFARRSFAYDAASAELRWYHSLTDHDDLVSLSLRYEFSSGWIGRLEAAAFSGDRAGVFGQFQASDRVSLSLTRRF